MKFKLLILSLIAIILLFCSLKAQNPTICFSNYYNWASEKHIDPGVGNLRLPFIYEGVKFAVKGNFNGDEYLTNVPIPEIALLAKSISPSPRLLIFTVESRGYRILNPANDYNSATFVSQQEGFQNLLEAKGQDIYNTGVPAEFDAYTEHSTIKRFEDASGTFYDQNDPNYEKIKFAVSGNFIGDNKDEILIFYQRDAGHQQIYLAANSSTTTSLNYNFDLSNIFDESINVLNFDLVKAVESGDYDGDGRDEVIIFQNSNNYNRIYRLYFDGSQWNFILLSTEYVSGFSFNDIIKTSTGDYDGNGLDDIAVISGNNNIYLYQNNDFVNYSTVFSGGIIDLPHVKQAVSGNFDGNTDGTSGRGKDALAIFYDPGNFDTYTGPGSVQTIFISDNNNQYWNFTPVIYEHKSDLNFSSSFTKFAFADNFDYDIKKRADIGIMYLDHNDNNLFPIDGSYAGYYEYNKILMWTSTNCSNYNISTSFTTPSQTFTTPQPFYPLGAVDVRLVTGFQGMDHLFEVQRLFDQNNSATYTIDYPQGRMTDDQRNLYSKYFNTVVPNRTDFVDSGDLWYCNLSSSTISGGFPYDVTSSSFDYYTGYVPGLKAYLDKAELSHLKVLPWLNFSEMRNLDDIITNNSYGIYSPESGTFVPYKSWDEAQFIDLNSSSTFYKSIYDPNNGIVNHPTILGWFISDEPTNIINSDVTHDPFVYRDQFRLANSTTMTQNDVDNMLGHYSNIVKNADPNYTPKPLMVNFNHDNDFDYYNQNCDIISFDWYPYTQYFDINTLEWAHSVQNYSFLYLMKKCITSLIRNNKKAAFIWGQCWGYSGGWEKDTINFGGNDHIYTRSIPYTASHKEHRFNLFAPAIEGFRGEFYFRFNDYFSNDTISNRILDAVSEFNNYQKIFLTNNLSANVSSSLDKYCIGDFSWAQPSTLLKPFNYSLHYDESQSMYYLFVYNCNWFKDSLYKSNTYESSLTYNMNVFINNSTQNNNVYLLGDDYFKNGLYDQTSSTFDGAGNYIHFSDIINKNEVKIYAIGGLPFRNTIAEETNFRGYLDYPNQRKLIAYSTTNDPNDNNLIRYHTVYHKLIPGTQRMGVYYKRSQPMSIREPQDLINWEPIEHFLSDRIDLNSLFQSGYSCTMTLNDCQNPSIVIRNRNGVAYVYVVYACNITPQVCPYWFDGGMVIAENVFEANSLIQSTGIGMALDKFKYPPLNDWGTPVINASANGNYYAWADMCKDIVVGFKNPVSSSLQAETNFAFNLNNEDCDPHKQKNLCQHPSLNTYSRIGIGEDECALVWQEKNYYNQTASNIYYTRLRINNNAIEKFLPQTICYPGYPFNAVYNLNGDIIRISDNDYSKENGLPSVYRDLAGFNPSYLTSKYDRIFWQGKDFCHIPVVGEKIIFYAGIDMLDELTNGTWEPTCWEVISPYRIRSNDNSLEQPNVSQGYLSHNYNLYENPLNDSMGIVNFISYPNSEIKDRTNSKIWQINFGHWSLFNNWDLLDSRGLYTDYVYANPVNGTGFNPNLSAQPVIQYGHNEWLQNRRIFETRFDNPPQIASSLQYFDKLSYGLDYENDAKPFFGFETHKITGNDTLVNMSIFSPFALIDKYDLVETPYLYTHHTNGISYLPCDTIYSDWFSINDYKKLKFLKYDYENKANHLEHVKIFIENERNKNKNEINNVNFTNGKYSKYNFILTNGAEQRYRLMYIKPNKLSSYTEEIVIGDLPNLIDENDRLEKTSYIYEDEQIIDLNTDEFALNLSDIKMKITVKPNPATDVVYVSTYKSLADYISGTDQKTKYKIKLFSSIGKEFYQTEVNAGETISIPISNIQAGVYFISAEEELDYWLTPLAPIIQGFVIER